MCTTMRKVARGAIMTWRCYESTLRVMAKALLSRVSRRSGRVFLETEDIEWMNVDDEVMVETNERLEIRLQKSSRCP